MNVTHDVNSIPLTSTEVAYLWNTYLLNSKSKQTLSYAIAKSDDKNIREIMSYALTLATQALDNVKKIFDGVKQAVPYGFDDKDAYTDAPKIYTDKLMLHILKLFTTVAASNYGTAISSSPRQDVRKLFTDSMGTTIDLLNKIDDTALEKGIYYKTPSIPVVKQQEIAEDKSIMGRFIGHKRPLTAIEISGVFNCSLADSVANAQLLGMAQTVQDDNIRRFLDKARNRVKEQIERLNDVLQKESLAVPPSFESEVLNSSTPAFSDKLSLFFCYVTIADLLAYFSVAKLGIMRKDLFLLMSELSGEILMLIKDAVDLMMEKGWFEEMPKNVERSDMTES